MDHTDFDHDTMLCRHCLRGTEWHQRGLHFDGLVCNGRETSLPVEALLNIQSGFGAEFAFVLALYYSEGDGKCIIARMT